MDTKKYNNLVDFRKTRDKTKKWPPEKKFTKFGNIRVPKLLRAMKSVKNLSIPYNPKTKIGYTWTPEQRKKLIIAIRGGWRELINAWENSEKKQEKMSKKTSFWDDEQ